jgi:uncharacterized protein (TIGR01777 family)
MSDLRVFVTGGSGYIGQALIAALVARGDRVVALSRRGQVAGATESVNGDPATPGEWQKKIAGCDAIIHLAGESIAAGRLDAAHRERVMASRREGTRQVVAAIAAARGPDRPKVLLSASGADLYPFDASDRSYAENAGAGDTFLAEVCDVWEKEARAAEAHGVRVARLRTGVVIGAGGGALAKMVTPFKLFAGGPIGSGTQWFSWISLEDTVGAYLHTLKHEALDGAVNLVAPGAVRQRDFSRHLGAALERPSWAPVPAFALRLAVGGLAEYLLHGRRVVPTALSRSGYAFRHADVSAALRESL